MTTRFSLKSLRTRLALFGSLLILIAVLFTSLMSYLEGRQRLRVMQVQHLEDVVTRLSEDIDDRVRTRHVLLEQAAASLQVGREQLSSRAGDILQGFRYLKGSFSSIMLFDANGNVVADYPELPGHRGSSVLDRQYFIQTRDTLRSQVSEPVRISDDIRRSQIIFTSPILDEHGQFAGILGGSLELFAPELFGDLRSIALGQTGYLTINTRASRLTIFHPESARIMQASPDITRHPDFGRALQGWNGSAEGLASNGEPALAVYRNLKNVGWVVSGILPVREAYAPIGVMARNHLLIILLAALLAFPVCWWGVSYLLQPVQALRRKVQAMQFGAADSIRVEGSQELEVLADTVAAVFGERERIAQELAAREAFFRALNESSPLGVFVTDAEGLLQYCNQATLQLGGTRQLEEDWLGRHWLAAVHPSQQAGLREAWHQLQCGHTASLYQQCLLAVSACKPCRVELRFTRMQQGSTLRFLGVVHDVSDREEALLSMTAERERGMAILTSIADAVVLTNQLDEVFYINPPAQRLLGLNAEEAHGRALGLFLSLAYPESGQTVSLATLAETSLAQPIELDLLSRDMRLQPVVLTLSVVQSAGSMHGYKVCVLHDDSERRRRERKHRWEASHDPLTGVLNRRGFLGALTQLLDNPDAMQQHNMLVMMDLDHFKQVNDSGGHQAGDQILQDLAAILQKRLRNTDVIARLGGDEFALLLYNCGRDTALGIMESVREDISRLRPQSNPDVCRVTASIGLTRIRDDDTRPHDVMQRADTRCYHAKACGRNRIIGQQPSDDSVLMR